MKRIIGRRRWCGLRSHGEKSLNMSGMKTGIVRSDCSCNGGMMVLVGAGLEQTDLVGVTDEVCFELEDALVLTIDDGVVVGSGGGDSGISHVWKKLLRFENEEEGGWSRGGIGDRLWMRISAVGEKG